MKRSPKSKVNLLKESGKGLQCRALGFRLNQNPSQLLVTGNLVSLLCKQSFF